MRKLFLLLAALVLVSCTEIVEVRPPSPNVRVYNSAWKVVAEDYAVGSRSTAPADLAAYVEDYNESHTDDQLFLVEGEAEIPVESAPKANAWIVDPATYLPSSTYLGIDRVDLSERRETWRAQAYAEAGVLFVDRIPPAPTPPPVLSDYERWALYLIGPDGIPAYEEHLPDEATFLARRELYQIEAYGRGPGWYVHSGSLYVPPEAAE